ncbi:hypothetical protein V8C34DRAFT_130327 [Trichoderma compactum]
MTLALQILLSPNKTETAKSSLVKQPIVPVHLFIHPSNGPFCWQPNTACYLLQNTTKHHMQHAHFPTFCTRVFLPRYRL